MPGCAQYVGCTPVAAANGETMRYLPGGFRLGALLKNISEAPWKPSKRNANLRAAKSARAVPVLYWGEFGEYTPAAHCSLAVLMASLYRSISCAAVSLPDASAVQLLGRPYMAVKKPLVMPYALVFSVARP